jgi:SAM-dependent methyltransferase
VGGGGEGGLVAAGGGSAGLGGGGFGVSTSFFPHAAAVSAMVSIAAVAHTRKVRIIKISSKIDWSLPFDIDAVNFNAISMDRLLEATAAAEREHFWFRGFRRFVTPLLDQAAAARATLRVLDCGCGTGNNLGMLRKYGQAVGIDITFSGLAYARRHGERLVARASALTLPFSDDTFDLVTSFDVIYAFDDVMAAQALLEMHRVLRPGGHLVLNVAALPILRGNHSVLGGEVQRYTRRGLAAHLKRAGFTVRRLTYTHASLLPVVAGVRFAQRLMSGRHRESDAEMRVPMPPVNLALSGVLAIEAAALRVVNMPLGSSLLALGVKGRTKN